MFGDWCRANGVSSATGFLAALSLAFTRVGRTIDLRLGGDQTTETVGFRSLVSAHTRHAAHWAEALGWFTAIAPLDVEFRDDQELVEILPIVGEAWARAKRGAGLPMSRIGELLDVPLQPRFVVSYLDARYVRSADRWQNWNAQAYLGDVGPTDEVYLWINRMLDETYVTWRYPGNDVCRAQIEAVTEAMRQIIVQSPLVTTQTALDAGEMSTQWL